MRLMRMDRSNRVHGVDLRFRRSTVAGGVMEVPLDWSSARSQPEGEIRSLRRGAVAVALFTCVLTTASSAQQPAATPESIPPVTNPRGDDEGAGPATPRRLPDALKFANGLLRQRKYELAAEEYERYTKSGANGRDLDDARFGLATARLYEGKFAESRRAFDEFLKGAAPDPRKLTARYRLGELAYLLGDLAAARRSLEEFTAATKDHPGLEMALTYLGDTCYGLQDFPPARLAYQRSLSAYPSGRLADRAKYGLGRTLAALGEWDQALKLMRELATPTKPEWVDRAWLQIGLIHTGAGRLGEAAVALERVSPSSPLRPEAQLQRALVLLRLGRSPEAEPLLRAIVNDASVSAGARAALELSTIELERNQPDAAASTLDAAFKRYPASPLVPAMHFRYAEALEQQKRLEEAQARFEQVIVANPHDPWADDAQQRAAQVALERGDSKGARRLAATFGARFPESPLKQEVRLVEARAAAREGKHDEAVAILKTLVEPAGDTGTKAAPALPQALNQAARYELALSYRALKQSDRADLILGELAKGPIGPVTGNAQFLIGQSHVTAGRYAEAVPPLRSYIKANSQGEVADVALAHLIVAELGLGDIASAWKTLATLADRFPKSRSLGPSRLRLAEAALAAHQTEQAAEQFRLVASSGGNKPTAPTSAAGPNDVGGPSLRVRALAGLGKSLAEVGKPAEAAAAFAAMLELAPHEKVAPEVALAQGRALEADKQFDAASKAYTMILERFAKSDQAPQAALAQARLFVREGRRDRAAAAFERLVGDPRARELIESTGTPPDSLLSEYAWILLDGDKVAEADQVFRRLLQEYPNSPHTSEARFNLAESANLAKNHSEVIRLLKPLAAAKRTERPAEVSKKTSATSKGTTADRATAADEALQRVLPAALYRLGRTEAELNDWAAAGATLDRLLREFPDNPYRRESRYLRAEAALQLGDAITAEQGFAALLAEPPAGADPKGMVTAARLKQIQSWVALKRWKDALAGIEVEKGGLPAVSPAMAELDYLRGQVLLGLGRIDEARASFQGIIDTRKAGELVAQALLMRGETYFHQDQFHEALRDFLRVDILYDAPRWQAAALLEAGKVYERLDQWADAAETYDRLLKKFPVDASAAQARQRLADATRRADAIRSGRKG
jgi:TolA-binding protein